MSDKYKGKYRGQTFRLKNWDYGSEALYFITICTQDREKYFGEIRSGKMHLSEIGKLAEKFWFEIPNQFDFIQLHEFIVMPDHIHGILEICKSDDYNVVNGGGNNGGGDNCGGNNCGGAINRTTTIQSTIQSTIPAIENKINGGFAGIKNPMFHDNISRVIRWYKGRCSFEIRKIGSEFKWQSLFHDHIIRDDESFQRIREYIRKNPKNWKEKG